jgi:hypothetical protein
MQQSGESDTPCLLHHATAAITVTAPVLRRVGRVGDLALWAYAASASIMKSVTSDLRQLIAFSGPPKCLSRTSDRLNQARVFVLDVADASSPPCDNLLGRARARPTIIR